MIDFFSFRLKIFIFVIIYIDVSGTGTGADPNCYDYFGTTNTNMFPLGPELSSGTMNIFIRNLCPTPIENITPIFIFSATGTSTPPVGTTVSFNPSCPTGATIIPGQVCNFQIVLDVTRNGSHGGTFYLMSSGGVGVDFPRNVTATVSALIQ